jgi:hypothetical protein
MNQKACGRTRLWLNQRHYIHFLRETEENHARTASVVVVGIMGEVSTGYLPHTGHAVTLLVEALCYKPEGRGFDFR